MSSRQRIGKHIHGRRRFLLARVRRVPHCRRCWESGPVQAPASTTATSLMLKGTAVLPTATSKLMTVALAALRMPDPRCEVGSCR